jgi:hypothetical protein
MIVRMILSLGEDQDAYGRCRHREKQAADAGADRARYSVKTSACPEAPSLEAVREMLRVADQRRLPGDPQNDAEVNQTARP